MMSARLPLPAALLARRSRNAKSALERHHNAYYAWEVSIRLAAAAHMPATIAPLRRGTLGEWRRALGERRSKSDDQALRGLFSHLQKEVHGTATERASIVLAELLDLLVAYRNRFIGHGSVVQRDEFYLRGAELLQSGLECAWKESVFLEQQERLCYVETVELSATGRAHGRVFDLDSSLPELLDHGQATMPDGTVPRRVYCVRGQDWVSLHPWVFHDQAAEAVYCFNGLGRRALYLDYASGKEVSGPELDALCPGIEQEVRALFDSFDAGDQPTFIAARAGSMRVGRYEVLGKLGQGGMGAVYLARQDPLGRLVALKVLPEERATDPVAIARFQREIAALARCDHPNVVKILDAGQASGLHYYAMEYVEGADLGILGDDLSTGKSLAAAISSASERRRETWKESFPAAPELPRATAEAPQALDRHSELASFAAQVARGLEYLHSHHVVHRDVKPSNLMAAAFDRRAVVMDLGVALLSDASQRITLEQSPLLGTIRYMSPEQVQRSILQIDHRSDVYSLGVSLYELLTGRPYVQGDTEAQLIQRILFEEPRGITRADGVPKDLARIVWKATRKNPDERYGSAALMAADLEAFVEHRPISVRRRMPWYVAGLFVRRRPVATLAAVFAMATVIFGTRMILEKLERMGDVHAEELTALAKKSEARVMGRTLLIEARALESTQGKSGQVADKYLQAAEHLRGLDLLEARVEFFEALCKAAEFDLDSERAAGTCREAWSVFESLPAEARSEPEIVQDRLSLLLRQARLARDQGDATMELQWLDKVRAELPSDDPRALGMWQRLAVLAPDKSGMLEALERAFHASSRDQDTLMAWVDALDDVGWSQLQDGDPETAYATYSKALLQVVPWFEVDNYPPGPEEAFRALNAGLGVSLAWVRSGEPFATLPQLALFLEVDIAELTDAGDNLSEPQLKLLSSVVERMGYLLPALSDDRVESGVRFNVLEAFFLGARRVHELGPAKSFDSTIDGVLAAMESPDADSFTDNCIEFLRTSVLEKSRPVAFVRLAAILLGREASTGLQLLDEWQSKLVEGDSQLLIAAGARIDAALEEDDNPTGARFQLAEAEKCLQAAGSEQLEAPEGRMLTASLLAQQLALASSDEVDGLSAQLQSTESLTSAFSVVSDEAQNRVLEALQGAVQHLRYSLDRPEEALEIAMREITLRRALISRQPATLRLHWDLGVALANYSALAENQSALRAMFAESLDLRIRCLDHAALYSHDIANLGIDLAEARVLGIEGDFPLSPEGLIERALDTWRKGEFLFPSPLCWESSWALLPPEDSKRIASYAVDLLDVKIAAHDGSTDDWFHLSDLHDRRALLEVAARLWEDDVETSCKLLSRRASLLDAELDDGPEKWLELLQTYINGGKLLADAQNAAAGDWLEDAIAAHSRLVASKTQISPYLYDSLIELAHRIQRTQVVEDLLALVRANAIELSEYSLARTLLLVANVRELEASGAIEEAWRALRENTSGHSEIYASYLEALNDQVGTMVIAKDIESPDTPAILCATSLLMRQALYPEAAQMFLTIEASSPDSLAHLLDPSIAYARLATALPEEKELWDRRCLAGLERWMARNREALIQLEELKRAPNEPPELLRAYDEDSAAIALDIKRAHEQETAFSHLRGTEEFERLFR